MPELEKNLEEARLKAWAAKVKNVRKMEAELEKNISQLHSIHQAKIERKDAFCEEEKVRVATELLASYNAQLPSLYAQQYEYGY